MNDEFQFDPEAPPEPRYIGFERGLSKPELDAVCKKLFPLEFEKIQKGHLRTSVDLFLEELLPNAIQLIPHGDPKAPETLFSIGYDITGRSESYVAKQETSLRIKMGNARPSIERVFGRMLRIDEFDEPALPRPPIPPSAPEEPGAQQRFARPIGQSAQSNDRPRHDARPAPSAPRHIGQPSGRPGSDSAKPRDARPHSERSGHSKPAASARQERPRDQKAKQFSR